MVWPYNKCKECKKCIHDLYGNAYWKRIIVRWNVIYAMGINDAKTEHVCESLIISLRSSSVYMLTVWNYWLMI